MKATMITVVLVVLLAACGGSDDVDTNGGGANASVGQEAVTEAASTTEDEPVAEGEPLAEDGSAAADTSVESSASADQAEATSDAAPAQAAGPTPAGFSLYNFRYCELLISVAGDDGVTMTEVWGTPGVGPCEDDAWNAIDIGAIADEFDASSIIVNGPRYFVVDGTADVASAASGAVGAAAGGPTETRDFGDVAMRLLATVVDDGVESVSYAPELVARSTTWTYNAGSEIYELTDPEGNVYVMQSYALIHDSALTAADLATLGDRLELPEGWTYAARVLDEDLQLGLTPDGALVLQDELANSYQRNG